MHGKLTQPKIDGYISWLRRNDHFGMTSCIYDDKSQKLLDELFELLEQVAPESPNGVRTLWLRAERGPIEDFGNAAEEIEERRGNIQIPSNGSRDASDGLSCRRRMRTGP